MADAVSVRLELMKVLLPTASRVGLASGEVIDRAHQLEQYVLKGKEQPKPEKPQEEKAVAKETKPRQNTRRKKSS